MLSSLGRNISLFFICTYSVHTQGSAIYTSTFQDPLQRDKEYSIFPGLSMISTQSAEVLNKSCLCSYLNSSSKLSGGSCSSIQLKMNTHRNADRAWGGVKRQLSLELLHVRKHSKFNSSWIPFILIQCQLYANHWLIRFFCVGSSNKSSELELTCDLDSSHLTLHLLDIPFRYLDNLVECMYIRNDFRICPLWSLPWNYRGLWGIHW